MILLSFLISLSIGLYAEHNPILVILISLLYLIFIFKRCTKQCFYINLAILISGVILSFINISYNSKEIYNGIVFKTSENYILFNSGGERFYVYIKNNSYEIGDILTIKGNKENLSFIKLESAFDFKKYLNNKGVNSQLEIENIEVRLNAPFRIKYLKNAFLSHFDDETRELVRSILFSESGESELTKDISSFHLNAFLKTSGLYVQSFLSMFSFLLSLKLKEKHAKLIAIICLIPFLIMSFPRFAVIKCVFLSLERWINKYKLDNKFTYFTLLGFSGLLFLSINRYLVYSDSFILGYSIPIISYFINEITSSWKKIHRLIFRKILIIPIFLLYEMKFYNCITPISNLLNYLFKYLFIVYSIFSLLCLYKIPLENVVIRLTRFISKIFSFIRPLSFSIACPKFNPTIAIIYVFIFIGFIYYFSIYFKPIYKCLLLFLTFIPLVNMIPFSNFITNQVSFINVGQGDSCLVRIKNKTVLIDVGGSLYQDIANGCLMPYLRKNRINKIDYLITTHNDYDHSGAKDDLMKYFKVKNYITSPIDFPLTYKEVTFINYNNHIEPSDGDNNDNSLVIGFNLMDLNFLIMGDAPISVENAIMKEYDYIPCDILKVGHHGSNTSTSDKFIKYLNPKEAIISVGRNYYGHPNKDVINTLKRNNVIVKRTDELGTITYSNYIFM